MIAIGRCVRPNTSSETELCIGDEGGPLVVLQRRAEAISIYQTANCSAISLSKTDYKKNSRLTRIPIPIGTMRVQLPAFISLGHVNLREISNTRNLHIVGRFHEMHAPERPVRHQSSSTAGFSTPRDFLALRVSDGADAWRSPETEIVDVVDPSCLAHRSLT